MKTLVLTLLLSGSAFGAESVYKAFVSKRSGCGVVFTTSDAGVPLLKYYSDNEKKLTIAPLGISDEGGDRKVQSDISHTETIMVSAMEGPRSDLYEMVRYDFSAEMVVTYLCRGMKQIRVSAFPWE